MKLSEIIAKLTGLDAKVQQVADASIKAEVTSLQGLVNSQLTEATNKLSTAEAQITALTGKVSTAEATVTALTTELTNVKTSLTGALAAFKVEAKGNASEMVTSLQNAVTTTLSKLNVPAGEIPTGATKDNQTHDAKVKSRAAFETLNPTERMAFIKSGGKLAAE